MLIIGLTGGIGSGKSTVAHLFSEKNIPIIDTDHISRTLTKPRTAALTTITRHFGKEMLTQEGTLDRAKLKTRIFSDPDARTWLEEFLHPLIRREVKQQVERLSMSISYYPYCIVAIPLLFETEPNPLIQRVLLVDAPETEQIARILVRDALSESSIKAIIATQMPREKKRMRADDIIDNSGSIKDLITQVDALHLFYLSLVKPPS